MAVSGQTVGTRLDASSLITREDNYINNYKLQNSYASTSPLLTRPHLGPIQSELNYFPQHLHYQLPRICWKTISCMRDYKYLWIKAKNRTSPYSLERSNKVNLRSFTLTCDDRPRTLNTNIWHFMLEIHQQKLFLS